MLRTTPNNVTLIVCRPRDERYRKLSPPTEPPKPPQRSSNIGGASTSASPLINSMTLPLEPLSPILTNFNGEFEIIMTKQQGSLGFTLRKEDDSVLGHYVRALVRDPALNDGRIKPGDKIVAVNDIPMSPMTHEEAVIFLRQSADMVKLRLYRDEAQTPVAALSPTNPENKSFSNTLTRTKVNLRPEAINLLSDLAYRRQTPCDSTGSSLRSITTTTTNTNTISPRRLKRGKGGNGGGGNNTTTSSSQSDVDESRNGNCSGSGGSGSGGGSGGGIDNGGYLISTQTSCSDSDTSTFSQCSFVVQTATNSDGCVYTSDDCGVTTVISPPSQTEYYEEDELFQMVDDDDDDDDVDGQRPDRPNFLNLIGADDECGTGQSGSTPSSSRKPRFQFTVAANSYELNNLDNEALDAPIYLTTTNNTLTNQNITNIHNNNNNNKEDYQDFNSLPCETFLVACMTESDLNNSTRRKTTTNFHHKNPMYQSAVIPPSSSYNTCSYSQSHNQHSPSVTNPNNTICGGGCTTSSSSTEDIKKDGKYLNLPICIIIIIIIVLRSIKE